MLSLIACVDRFGGIGRKGTIPWKDAWDLKFFKKTTLNSIVIMGRKTFESLGCKPLENRTNVVVTTSVKSPIYLNGATYIPSLSEILYSLKDENVFIIGGASVYKKAFDLVAPQQLIISFMDIDGECDTFFPAIPIQYKPSSIKEIRTGYFRIIYDRTF